MTATQPNNPGECCKLCRTIIGSYKEGYWQASCKQPLCHCHAAPKDTQSNCPSCQYEDGEHSLGCSYKFAPPATGAQQWEKTADDIVVELLNVYGFKTAFYANRPPELYEVHPYPELHKLHDIIRTQITTAEERSEAVVRLAAVEILHQLAMKSRHPEAISLAEAAQKQILAGNKPSTE